MLTTTLIINLLNKFISLFFLNLFNMSKLKIVAMKIKNAYEKQIHTQ